jgi:hypothetical protein
VATLHFQQTTTPTPEQFVAGLTDFGPDRSKLFENSADGYLKEQEDPRSRRAVGVGDVGGERGADAARH